MAPIHGAIGNPGFMADWQIIDGLLSKVMESHLLSEPIFVAINLNFGSTNWGEVFIKLSMAQSGHDRTWLGTHLAEKRVMSASFLP